MVSETDILADLEPSFGYRAADIAWGRTSSTRRVAAQLSSMRRRGLVAGDGSRPTRWTITADGERARGPQTNPQQGE